MDEVYVEKDLNGEGARDPTVAQTSVSANHEAAADTRVRRKLDLHMMSLFFVLCEYSSAMRGWACFGRSPSACH